MLIGKQLGRYEIRRRIGAGGMGEVYLAYDSALDRDVALKLLSSDFSKDETRKNRFRQEARAASALNHPNIITIYEIGESEYGIYLATELIDGETLRETLKRAPLSVSRAVKIAEQIATALSAAHEAGIIHRDIKPENIMMRRDRIVKVLDFGLAKPTMPTGSEDATQQIVQTTPGMIMGSVRYMSPEQARGKTVDGRTDIWNLGCLLYEMLAGRPAFDGESTSDTLAAIIYKEPEPISQIVPNVPAELQRILRKTLKKDRDERYQNIKDFALDLKNLAYDLDHEISVENQTQPFPSFIHTTGSGSTAIHRTVSGERKTGQQANAHTTVTSAEYIALQVKSNKWQSVMASVGILAMLAAIGFGFYRWFKESPKPVGAAFEKTQISRLITDGKVRIPAISPDGKYVAYVSGELGNRGLVVRQVATDSLVTIVQPSPLDFRSVNFSPDGNYIYYTQLSRDYSLGTLYQIPTLGGTPKKIAEDVDSAVSFSPDGKRLAFMRNSTKENSNLIFVADADGSNLKELTGTKNNSFNSFTAPAWSPDGNKLLVGAGKENGGNQGAAGESIVAEISVSDGGLKALSSKKWAFIESLNWLKDGTSFLLTARETEEAPMQVWRVSYPSGETQGVTNDFNNYFGIGLSADGTTLITLRGDSVTTLWSLSPATKELIQLMPESRGHEGKSGVAQTADNKIVYSRFDGKDSHIWLMDADGKNARQLTSELRYSFNPTLTPDGRFIVFVAKKAGAQRIWRMDADGKNAVQITENSENYTEYNPQVTADGKEIVFQRYISDLGKDRMMKVPIDGGVATPVFPDDQVARFMPRLSPDGKLLAFISFDTISLEKKLRVAAFDNNTAGELKNTFDYNLISNFSWSPDSKSLTYISSDGVSNLWKLPLDGSKPQPLTDFKTGNIFNFAWSRDGKRLFLVRGIVNNDLVLIKDSGRSPQN